MFNADKLMRDLDKNLAKQLNQQFTDITRRLRCPVHGKSPIQKNQISSIKDQKIQFDCCCGVLREMLEKALK